MVALLDGYLTVASGPGPGGHSARHGEASSLCAIALPAHLARGTSHCVRQQSAIASLALLAAAAGFVVAPGIRSGTLLAPWTATGAVQAAEAAGPGSNAGSNAGPGAGSIDRSNPPDGLDAPVGALDPASLTGYAWPLKGARLTQPFAPSPYGTWLVDGQLFHDGLDLATFCGDHVLAAHDGVVLAAGRSYDDQLGWVGGTLDAYNARLDAKKLRTALPIVIVIDDGNGYRSIYAHFSQVIVKAGDTVKAGQMVGYEGRSGNASGCHVHYGLFSPAETATFSTEPTTIAHMLLPPAEIARIDPLLVLPAEGRPADAPAPLASLPVLPTVDDWAEAARASAEASAAAEATAVQSRR
jgi:murein DD-endopeptidase MepM/ murein hydrolase activator NlpD